MGKLAWSNPSSWERVTCYAGRVVGVDLNAVGASGSLDNFGRLTELTDLRLSSNNFSGDAGCRAPAGCFAPARVWHTW